MKSILASLLLLVMALPLAHAQKKLTTEVVVLTKDGKPASGKKVSLEFTAGLGGFTDDYYTDKKGVALIKHASEGTVKVFVDGDHSSHKTTGRAPGTITVRLTR
jgi:hypothetical protein